MSSRLALGIAPAACDFFGESEPATSDRPERVLGGRGGRVEGARSECCAAGEQLAIGEHLEGFSQLRRRVYNKLLQRDHRRGARLDRGIACDLQLAHHLDRAIRSLRGRCRLLSAPVLGAWSAGWSSATIAPYVNVRCRAVSCRPPDLSADRRSPGDRLVDLPVKSR